MAGYSTMKVGGPVEALMVAERQEELIDLLPWLAARHIPWKVIGRGSNILVPDQGLAGVAIILGGEFEQVSSLPPTLAAAST